MTHSVKKACKLLKLQQAVLPIGILCILWGNVNHFLCLYKASWFVGSDYMDYKVNIKHEFGVVQPYRTFSNHCTTDITRNMMHTFCPKMTVSSE